jgi:quinol monooxygenase YgiN
MRVEGHDQPPTNFIVEDGQGRFWITGSARRETEPGCRQFDACRDPADASLFFLYELYDDESAIQAHLKSPHFQLMERRTADWVQSKRVRTLRRAAP